VFLTPDDLADLTGIRTGRNGRTRGQLQADHLRRIGVPFWFNAAGDPKVARAFFEGSPQRVAEPARWRPAKAA